MSCPASSEPHESDHRRALARADLLRARALQRQLPALTALYRTCWLYSARDMAFDWTCVGLSVAACLAWGHWAWPLAMLVVANRQCALNNLLHDAAHFNIDRRQRLNDSLCMLMVAPALMNDLSRYRELHLQHHAWLGHEGLDPDWLAPPRGHAVWWRVYARHLFRVQGWWNSVTGHLAAARLPAGLRWYLLVWWAGLLSAIALCVGTHASLTLGVLWWGTRMTLGHAAWVMRELCDHHGLAPGGIFSQTRDIHTRSPLRWLLHPRNDGYHLIHHLLPRVPYRRLPEAFAQVHRHPLYRARTQPVRAYLWGGHALVRAWESPQPDAHRLAPAP